MPEEDRETYNDKKRICKVEVAWAKDLVLEEMIKELEENGLKEIYRLARTRHRWFKDINELTFVEEDKGGILREERSIKEGWKGYLSTLLSVRNTGKKLPTTNKKIQGPTDDALESNVISRLEKVQVKKAAGPDELHASFLHIEVLNCRKI